MKLKYLVCGTGRCGTVYMARIFTSLGIPCGHESIFNHEGLKNALCIINNKKLPKLSKCSQHDILADKPIKKWINEKAIIAESSYMAAPFLDNKEIKDVPLIHIVRHPLKVITSWIQTKTLENNVNPWGKFIYKHLPLLKKIKDPIDKACYYYIEWNKIIESKYGNRKHLFFRVEDDTKKIVNFLNVSSDEDIFKNREINSWRKTNYLSTEEIGNYKKDILNIIYKYGYKPECTEKHRKIYI